MKDRILILFILCNILNFSVTNAQGEGPRTHLFAPTGAWVLNPLYLNLDQNLTPSNNLLIKNANIGIDLFPIALVHTFGIGGKLARVYAMVTPGSLNGKINTNSNSLKFSADGFADGYIAFEYGLIGTPALNLIEYSTYQPQFSLNAIFRYRYSGSYDKDKALNLGTNRAAFEFGTTMAIPFHKDLKQNATWLEIFPSVQFFNDNKEPFNATKVSQRPLFILENNITHNLNKKLFIGADLLYNYGGESKTDGVSNNNLINTLSGGLSVGYQVNDPISIYASYGTIFTSDNDAESNMFRISLVFT